MTCRCPMCGKKDANNGGRGSYIKAGVRCNENGTIDSDNKRRGRRLRRFRENRQWREDT